MLESSQRTKKNKNKEKLCTQIVWQKYQWKLSLSELKKSIIICDCNHTHDHVYYWVELARELCARITSIYTQSTGYEIAREDFFAFCFASDLKRSNDPIVNVRSHYAYPAAAASAAVLFYFFLSSLSQTKLASISLSIFFFLQSTSDANNSDKKEEDIKQIIICRPIRKSIKFSLLRWHVELIYQSNNSNLCDFFFQSSKPRCGFFQSE